KNNDQVIISIFNSGSYISKANIPKLFGKFNKLEESYTNKTQESGTGLGLYICKQIVEMHKGRIDVTSDENSGTTFAIYLPILKK
ncbi:MAG: HAMP domain-containing sensor histidine kinase, partial [bacterium]|nr:HAMP domain-containing sensor histidine kinase [bacterium]